MYYLILKKESKNINDYKIIIKEKCLSLISETVEIPRFGMSSKPWQSWIEGDDNPDWWRANNYIKHNRTQNFEKANLKNAFNSVGALLITTLYFYKYQLQNTKGSEIDWQEITSILKPRNSLFILNENYYSDPGIMKWGAREW